MGGLINALVTDNGFVLATRVHGIVRPGAISNVAIGAVPALVSWAFYGSGASKRAAWHGAGSQASSEGAPRWA